MLWIDINNLLFCLWLFRAKTAFPLMVFNKIQPEYPGSVVEETNIGFGLFASLSQPKGSILQKFTSSLPIFAENEYEKIPVAERAHCLLHRRENIWVWMIPESNARYANHSCQPNSFINSRLEIEALKDVEEGEEVLCVTLLLTQRLLSFIIVERNKTTFGIQRGHLHVVVGV